MQVQVDGDHLAARMQSAHLLLADQRLADPAQA